MLPSYMNVLSLFSDLRALSFDRHEKQSAYENLTDVLEIISVARGLKPAHLNGQGLRSERLLLDLEAIAERHGLLHHRTHSIVPCTHRPPNYHPSIVAWEREKTRQDAFASPKILWLYRTRSLTATIDSAAAGVVDVSAVLGYPLCCVNHDSEASVTLGELYVDALAQQFGAADPEAINRLRAADTRVTNEQITNHIRNHFTHVQRSRELLPFVSFTACTDCLERRDSPAARLNGEMRALALDMAPDFAAEIQRAITAEGSRPAPTAGPAKKVGRNDPCPCGSGRKFKRCCGR